MMVGKQVTRKSIETANSITVTDASAVDEEEEPDVGLLMEQRRISAVCVVVRERGNPFFGSCGRAGCSSLAPFIFAPSFFPVSQSHFIHSLALICRLFLSNYAPLPSLTSLPAQSVMNDIMEKKITLKLASQIFRGSLRA